MCLTRKVRKMNGRGNVKERKHECTERISRAENRVWDTCTIASFERTHSTVCSLKNSPCTEAMPSGIISIILKGHFSLSLCPIHEQGMRSLGNNGDIFRGPSVSEQNGLPKPKGYMCWINGQRAQRGKWHLRRWQMCVFAHVCILYVEVGRKALHLLCFIYLSNYWHKLYF